MVEALELSTPVDGRAGGRVDRRAGGIFITGTPHAISRSGYKWPVAVFNHTRMRAMTSDDDARIFNAERNGASSFLLLSAEFKSAAEVRSDLSVSKIVLNRSNPQAFRSITLADTSVVFKDPNSLCLSWSFNWSFNSLSTSAASLSLDDFPDSVTESPLKSVKVIFC